MEKTILHTKFRNERFKCKCIYGRCPNYSVKGCGIGGSVISKKLSYDNVLKSLKKTLQHDEYVGTKSYYSRRYKDKRQEKRDGK